ncbi:MAG: hypothetical protein WAM72_07225 [Xanthobacteraceae bacterium]
METLLKKSEIFRDSMGRFDRHGKTLSKTAKRTNGHLIKKNEEIKRESDGKFSKGQGGPRAGAGRPKGSKNRVTLQLKEAILNALDSVGGEQYLAKLAIENSSAFSSLLGKILPHTLAPSSESNGGLGVKMVFERHIVWPDGHREIEGVTPKQLPAPSPVSVENNDQLICVEKPSQNSASDDQ